MVPMMTCKPLSLQVASQAAPACARSQQGRNSIPSRLATCKSRPVLSMAGACALHRMRAASACRQLAGARGCLSSLLVRDETAPRSLSLRREP
jgi:hypothetical protein